MINREYDLIIFGATGFTGKLICDYISKHKDSKSIKWSIAGRDSQKLKEISKEYSVDYLLADSFNDISLNVMCRKSKLIITTVGPYNIYGENLVAACIKNNTHYLDLTGEPNFVKKINNKYNKIAENSSSIIIHSCGFESIPSDIGVYITVKELDTDNIDLTYYLKTKGKISGGTWASFLNSISSEMRNSAVVSKSNNFQKPKKLFYSKKFKKWALIFPVIDKYIVMKSSQNVQGYGENFNFNLYTIQKSLFSVLLLILGILTLAFLSKFKFIKKFLLSRIPSGSGPSKEERKRHWFKISIIGKTTSNEVCTTISGGDPGYDETAKFISEMGLCILTQNNDLLKKNGILTPVECTGNLMIDRLKDAGIIINTSTIK